MSKELKTEIIRRIRYSPIAPGLFVTGQTAQTVADDDGDLEVGYKLVNRWRIVSADVLYDNRTGLYWPRDWTGAGIPAINTSWNGTIINIRTIASNGFGGFFDWRMPNAKELFSLLDFGMTNGSEEYWDVNAPWINDAGLVPKSRWTSTSRAVDTSYAVIVNFGQGSMNNVTKITTTNRSAIPCRGGPT